MESLRNLKSVIKYIQKRFKFTINDHKKVGIVKGLRQRVHFERRMFAIKIKRKSEERYMADIEDLSLLS